MTIRFGLVVGSLMATAALAAEHGTTSAPPADSPPPAEMSDDTFRKLFCDGHVYEAVCPAAAGDERSRRQAGYLMALQAAQMNDSQDHQQASARALQAFAVTGDDSFLRAFSKMGLKPQSPIGRAYQSVFNQVDFAALKNAFVADLKTVQAAPLGAAVRIQQTQVPSPDDILAHPLLAADFWKNCGGNGFADNAFNFSPQVISLAVNDDDNRDRLPGPEDVPPPPLTNPLTPPMTIPPLPRNSIVVCPGLLTADLGDTRVPAALRPAVIAATVGHELGHSIGSGSEYAPLLRCLAAKAPRQAITPFAQEVVADYWGWRLFTRQAQAAQAKPADVLQAVRSAGSQFCKFPDQAPNDHPTNRVRLNTGLGSHSGVRRLVGCPARPAAECAL